MSAAEPRTAFVTGGSGFIGGRLIRRLVARGLERAGTGALATPRPRRSAGAGAEAVARRPRTIAGAARGRARAATSRSTPLHTSGDWGDPAGVRARQRRRHAQRARGEPGAGVRRFVHVGTEAGGDSGATLVERGRRAHRCDPTLKAARLARPRPLAEKAAREANARRLRDRRSAAAARVGPKATRAILPSSRREAVEDGRFAWIGGGGAQHLHHPRGQHGRSAI